MKLPINKLKNKHAVILGRKGGKIGGRIRAQNLSPERRSEIARLGAQAMHLAKGHRVKALIEHEATKQQYNQNYL